MWGNRNDGKIKLFSLCEVHDNRLNVYLYIFIVIMASIDKTVVLTKTNVYCTIVVIESSNLNNCFQKSKLNRNLLI